MTKDNGSNIQGIMKSRNQSKLSNYGDDDKSPTNNPKMNKNFKKMGTTDYSIGF